MIDYKPLPDRKKLTIRKLEPPKEVKYRAMQKDRERKNSNKIIGFLKTFFIGDGF